MNHKNQLKNSLGVTMRKLIPGIIFAAAFVLSACGGGADNTESASNGSGFNGGGGASPYTGPSAQNDDIQNFRVNFWENIRGDNRCGSCHDVNGTANSDFANNSNVNSAYGIAIGLVNTNDIPNSTFVRRFSQGTGHFCWESTQSACATQLELWIGNWLSGSSGSGGRSVVLTPPADENPSPATSFNANVDPSYFSGNGGLNIHTLITANCAGCHVPNSTLGPAQQPYFAVTDTQASYDSVSSVPLINLSTSALSRFYTRLNNDGHRCWDAGNGISCADSAAQMLNAINYYIDQATQAPDMTELNSMVKSRAVTLLEDGIVASGGNRFEASQIALYEFKLGSGDTIIDRSGVSPAMNLTLFGSEGVDYEWLGSYGVQFNTSIAKAQADTADSNKLQTMISSTGEYTIEAWVLPANVSQEDATMVAYGLNSTTRNFMLAQTLYNYEMYNRNSSAQTNPDATPLLTTDPDDEDAQSSLQHVVVTYDPTNGRRIYVNGTFRDDVDPLAGDGLSNWATGAALVLGNDVGLDRPWAGTMRLLAVHNRALSGTQIRQNFDVGVGQKFFLMFEISEHLPQCQGPDPDPGIDDPIRDPDYAPLCFVYLEAAQFDNSSFLFAYPRFVTLDNSINVDGVRIRNMRVGINGREASSGQGFASIDVTLGQPTAFDPAVGQALSDIGTVVALENGPSGNPVDQLFLTFEQLGAVTPTKDYTENFSTTPDPMNPVEVSAVNIRSFEQINATMSAMTSVDRTTARVNQNNVVQGGNAANNGTYTKVKQALPGSADVTTYVPSNQMAITQLSIEYCNALVDGVGNTIPRGTYFPGVTFNDTTSPNMAFSTQPERDLIINPLLERVFNVDGATELTTMPSAANVRAHLNTLMADLTAVCVGNCEFARTQIIIKSTCAAAIGSSAMLLQ
ncbi:FIG00702062: hypothetical protein [hydrothermal vent metagenome]|uniref:LamG-like jellyroll fold domain-containing protein n=1 Tax=hydrothermal vent metagenome TaxID=652676 RepID=A0A3B0ZZB2_9ZZZZ